MLTVRVTASILPQRIFLTQPGRSLNAGYSWPGVFLLGASGRTGRFFTRLLFHNPHSAAIRQIHWIWQWKKQNKTKTKTEEDWPCILTNRSLMHINRSMVFLTRVNRFTCNICTSSFQMTELCTYKENLIWCDQKSPSIFSTFLLNT